MFIEDGIRWIIDYKSGTPEEAKNEKEFCEEQIARHKHQLKSYHTIASNLYPEKIKTALFFTAIAVFKEVTV